MNGESVLIRVHELLKKEFQEIIEYRREHGLPKLSYRKIALLMTRHNGWQNIKNDIGNYMEDDEDE